MRLLRVLVVATGFAALLAAPSAAQEGRPFRDAWFWGVRGGVLNYSSDADLVGPANGQGTDNAGAPMVGIDWLITRTRGGLYLGVDEAFFTTSAYYRRPAVAGDPAVMLKNERRISLAGMWFPMQSPMTHPYIGLGLSVNQVGDAALERPLAIPALQSAAIDSVQAKKVAISPLVIAGIQQRLPGFSVFAQGSGTWLQNGFLLKNLAPKHYLQWSLEAGIRYNVGSSIDRDR
jgi:hypothetical protein